MKTVLIVLMLLGCAGCRGLRPVTLYQKEGKLLGILPLVNDKVVYQARYALPGLSQEAICQRASRWFSLRYPGSKTRREVEQKETISLRGNALTRVHVKSASVWQVSHYRLGYVVSIRVHESAYDVTMSALAFYLSAVNVYTAGRWVPIEAYQVGQEKSLLATYQAVDGAMGATLSDLWAYVQQPPIKGGQLLKTTG